MGNSVSGVQEILGEALVSKLCKDAVADYDQTLTLPELDADVRVTRDAAGVPYIYAETESDALVAQGFVHAQDRLWQMEVSRRAGHGELSALLGRDALDSDIAARTLGWTHLAAEDWDAADTHLKFILNAYTRGVNAFIAYCPEKYPVEIRVLKARMEAWRPTDCLVIMRLMTSSLLFGAMAKVVRAALIEALGADVVAEIDIKNPAKLTPSVPKGSTKWAKAVDVPKLLSKWGGVNKLSGAFGSNAWAVSPQRSETGGALLASDPHLMLTTPNTFYLCHMSSVARKLHVGGTSLPGVPYVIMGNNEDVAWGVTLGYVDSEDVYLIEWRDESRSEYRYKHGWRTARTRDEMIIVKGESEPVIVPVVETHHGPVVTDQYCPVQGKPSKLTGAAFDLALQSTSLLPHSRAIEGMRALAYARDFTTFRAGCSLLTAPSLNTVYADAAGNIGTVLIGRIPLRRNPAAHLVPVPGDSDKNGWRGYVPIEEQPWVLNPPQGYVVAANQRPVADNYPYELGVHFHSDYRARRVAQLIESKAKISMHDMETFQFDHHSLAGVDFVAAACARGLFLIDAYPQRWLTRLQNWKGGLGRKSAEGLVYQLWVRQLRDRLLTAHLDDDLLSAWRGKGVGLLHPLTAFLGNTVPVLTSLLSSKEDGWFLRRAGGRAEVLRETFLAAIAEAKRLCGDDDAHWRWGRVHTLTMRHPFGRLNARMAKLFDVGPHEVPGDMHTVFMSACSPIDTGFQTSQGPCFRVILDMSNIPGGRWILPPGNSGQPLSPHYADLALEWSLGRYRPMLWTREQSEKAMQHAMAFSWAPSFSIPSTEVHKDSSGKPFAVFVIHVEQYGMREPHVVLRRFSEIDAFQKRVDKLIRSSGVLLPEMPSKTYLPWHSKVDANLVEKRRRALQAYLQAVYAKVPGARDAVLDFLALPKDLPSLLPPSGPDPHDHALRHMKEHGSGRRRRAGSKTSRGSRSSIRANSMVTTMTDASTGSRRSSRISLSLRSSGSSSSRRRRSLPRGPSLAEVMGVPVDRLLAMLRDARVSTRGMSLAQVEVPGLALLAEAVGSNMFHAKTRPGGIVNLAFDMNSLLLPEAVARISETAVQPEYIGYDNPSGVLRLRCAIAKFLARSFAFIPPIERVFIASGVGAILEHLAWHLCDPGDAVLVPTPYESQVDADLIARAQVRVIRVPTTLAARWVLSPAAVERAMKRARRDGIRVRAILITSPGNPTGCMYGREEMRELLRVCRKHDLHYISNEVHMFSVIEPATSVDDRAGDPDVAAQLSLAAVMQEDEFTDIRNRAHVVYGASRDFPFPGLRIGVLYTENASLCRLMGKSCVFTMSSTVGQTALADMLEDTAWLGRYLDRMQSKLRKRYGHVAECLDSRRIPYTHAQGGLSVFADLTSVLPSKDIAGEQWLQRKLVDEALVAVAGSASAFAGPVGWFRILVSNHSDDVFNAAIQRLFKVIEGLQT